MGDRARSLVLTPGLVTLAAMAATVGCRDQVDPFEVPGATSTGESGRLTFSVGDDRSPAWSADGDTIYYSAEGGPLSGLPADPGVLVALPLDSGTIRPLVSGLQAPDDPVEQWLVAPLPSPDRSRLAFAEIEPLHDVLLICTSAEFTCSPPDGPLDARFPPLRSVMIHVRSLDAVGDAATIDRLQITLDGVVFDDTRHPFELPGVYVVDTFPFQELFAERRSLIFSPSWSPDGDRLVLSDGLRLLVWAVGSDAADPIPGTDEGVSPAWSPDGEWIVYTRLSRADSTVRFCVGPGALAPCAVQDRTDYERGPSTLVRIRPDGSEPTELGPGFDPAWSPDGGTLFFHRDGLIWRSAPDGSGARPVPGTENGWEPAVAPDGGRLAFARLSPDGDYDIWVIEL